MIKACYGYVVEDEDDEAGVEEGEGHHHALVTLDRRKHLVQEGVQVGETAHENGDGYQTTQSVVSLQSHRLGCLFGKF